MPYLVRDWWPAGNKFITWPVNNLTTAYQEYAGTTPSTSADLQGTLTIVKQVPTTTIGGGTFHVGLVESSIWIYDSSNQEVYLDYTLEGHTGCWALTLDTQNVLTDLGVLIQDGYDYYPDDAIETEQNFVTQSSIEAYPSTRNFPDTFWELSGNDLYLTGATV